MSDSNHIPIPPEIPSDSANISKDELSELYATLRARTETIVGLTREVSGLKNTLSGMELQMARLRGQIDAYEKILGGKSDD